MYTQAKLQLIDGSFTNFQAKQPVILHKKSNTETSATFEALVLPTTEAEDSEIRFMFHVNNDNYQYWQTVNYASHGLYKLNFELNFSPSHETKTILLNTHIYPREVYPIENITVDTTTEIYTTNKPIVEAVASTNTVSPNGTFSVLIKWTIIPNFGNWGGLIEFMYDRSIFEIDYTKGNPLTPGYENLSSSLYGYGVTINFNFPTSNPDRIRIAVDNDMPLEMFATLDILRIYFKVKDGVTSGDDVMYFMDTSRYQSKFGSGGTPMPFDDVTWIPTIPITVVGNP